MGWKEDKCSSSPLSPSDIKLGAGDEGSGDGPYSCFLILILPEHTGVKGQSGPDSEAQRNVVWFSGR